MNPLTINHGIDWPNLFWALGDCIQVAEALAHLVLGEDLHVVVKWFHQLQYFQNLLFGQFIKINRCTHNFIPCNSNVMWSQKVAWCFKVSYCAYIYSVCMKNTANMNI